MRLIPAVAASSHAGLSLAIVSGKLFLKIPEFAIRLHVVAQGRTAGSHRFPQYLFDGRGQDIDLYRLTLAACLFGEMRERHKASHT